MTTSNDAPTVRDDLAAFVEELTGILAEHPDLPKVHFFDVSFEVKTRAELDGLAGDFGQAPPSSADNYPGAQFVVWMAGLRGRLIVAWRDEK